MVTTRSRHFTTSVLGVFRLRRVPVVMAVGGLVLLFGQMGVAASLGSDDAGVLQAPAATGPDPIRIDALHAVTDTSERASTSVGKWEQLPDEDGWDVMAMDRCLADDWACTRSGEVTDIHFWGSWHGGIEDTFYGL